MDRFDEMRSRGINTNDADATASDILLNKTAYVAGQKITGTYEPSGGGDDYNVYAQSTMPDGKSGIWIKTTADTDSVHFTPELTAKGHFIDGNFSGLNQTSGSILGQVIVGDILYVFGANSSTSFKYDLSAKSLLGNLNVPSTTVYRAIGSAYIPERNVIYCATLTGNSTGAYPCIVYAYYPETNTYETLYSGGSFDRSEGYNSMMSYNGGAYALMKIYDGSYYYLSICKIDGKPARVGSGVQDNSMSFYGKYYFGKYMYAEQHRDDEKIQRGDVTSGAWTSKTVYAKTSETYTKYGYARRILVNGDYIYLFWSGTRTEYGIFNWSTEELTIKECEPYNIESHLPVLDPITQRVYFRKVNADTCAFQLGEQDISEYSAGDIIVLQSMDGAHSTRIIDDSGLSIGVKDVFVVKSEENGNVLDNDFLTMYGNGEWWNVLKNPNSETATLSFDLAGGSGTFPSQTVIIGKPATAPTTEPSKSGYLFTGWYYGDKKYDFGRQITNNITLTAHYEAYEELDYIQSTGTQYIDTGFVPNQDTKIVIDLQSTSYNGSTSYSGGRQAYQNKAFMVSQQYSENTGLRFAYGNETYDVPNTLSDITRHTFTLDKNVAYIDETSIHTFTAQTFTSPVSMWIFDCNNNGASLQKASMKLYSYKLYDDGTLVRDFIPIKTASGAICLFDLVENKAYYNKGSGTFKEPLSPTLVSYIESTGTQYIDSGVKGSPKNRFEMDLQYTGNDISARTEINGLYWGNVTYKTQIGITNANGGLFVIGSATGSTSTDTTVPSDSSRHTFYADGTTGAYGMDGVQLGTYPTYSGADSSYNMLLFARRENSASSANLKCHEKLYSCKLFNNGALIRHFKPALDDNNVACLYDEVTNSYFYNAGTGTFDYGE